MAGRRQPATVRGRRLAAELSALRARAGVTREQVEEQRGVSIGTLFRIEKAQSRPQKRTMLALLDLYGVTDDEQRDGLLALWRGAAEQNWAQTFVHHLPEDYQTYISFEGEASSLSNYESLFVPGLLQTRDYARAVIHGVVPVISEEDVDQRVEVRLRRQNVLNRDDPTQLWAVVDEAAIRREVGGPEVLRAQLEHLIWAAEAPHITLQLVPYQAGAHPGMPGSFVVMDFPDPSDPALICADSMAGDTFLERESDVARYRTTFQRIVAQALSPADTQKILRRAAKAA